MSGFIFVVIVQVAIIGILGTILSFVGIDLNAPLYDFESIGALGWGLIWRAGIVAFCVANVVVYLKERYF